MIRRAFRLPLLLAALLLLPRPAAAQATPEEGAQRYFATLKAGDWAGGAALMHPRALEALKSMFVEIAAIDSTGEVVGPVLGASRAELRAMAPAEVYERLLRTAMGLAPQLGEMMAGAEIEPIGHVMEGDTAHVVYRLKVSIEGMPITQTTVGSFLMDGGDWKALLTADLQNLVNGLRAAAHRAGQEFEEHSAQPRT